MNTEIKNILKQVFSQTVSAITDADVDSFLNFTEFIKVKNKEIIIHPNSISRKAFFILKGTVRGYLIDDNGNEKNIILRPTLGFAGDTVELFTKSPARYTYETIGESELLMFKFSDFERLAENNSNIFKLNLWVYKEAILTLTYRIESMISKTAEQRYNDLLVNSPQFFESVYHKDIANYLGITPVSLSRIINDKVNNN